MDQSDTARPVPKASNYIAVILDFTPDYLLKPGRPPFPTSPTVKKGQRTPNLIFKFLA